MHCLQEAHLPDRDIHTHQVKWWIQLSSKQTLKQTRAPVLLSHHRNFKLKLARGGKKSWHLLRKRTLNLLQFFVTKRKCNNCRGQRDSQQWRAFAALAEDLGLVPRTHRVPHTSVIPDPGNRLPSLFWALHVCAQMYLRAKYLYLYT